MKWINTRFPDDLHAEIAEAAIAEERPIGSWLRIAAKEKLARDRTPPHPMEAIRPEIEAIGTAGERAAELVREAYQPLEREDSCIFDLTEGDWRVTAIDVGDGDAQVEFTYKSEPYRSLRYPAYKVWNIPAHLSDITADFEAGLELASWPGVPPSTPTEKGE
jgi:hypothetical protein